MRIKSNVALNFTISSIFKTISGMAISLIAIKIIGPEKLGLWQAALIVKPYIGFTQLGVTEGLGRQLPFYMGKNKANRVKKYVANAQFVTSIYTILFFLIAILLALFRAKNLEGQLIYLTAGVFISTMFVDNFLSSTYRSSKSFKDLSKVYIASSIIALLLIPLIIYYGFSGYLILLFIHSLLSTILLIIYRPFKVKSKFLKRIYFDNVKIGFPILSLNYIRNLPDTYPKIFIVFFISTTALGLTAPANAVLTAFSVLPAALAKYLIPTMTFDYAKSNDKTLIWNRIKKISFYLSLFGMSGLLSLFIIPDIIENYFPKYEEAIFITILAVIIGFFRMFALIFQVFNTLKRYREQFKVSLSRNLLYFLSPGLLFLIAPVNKQLSYIFIGILIAELISTFITFYFVYKVTHDEE
jgi:O-antigen/teichoic acid export membrane protein